MKKGIVFLIFLPFLFANRCVTKEMWEKRITVENKLNTEVYLLPYRIERDYYDLKFTKDRIIHNYFIHNQSISKIFHTPFCMKEYWDRTVIGDTLEILVFVKDTLEEDKTLEELVTEKSYTKKIKLTYNQLIKDICTVVID